MLLLSKVENMMASLDLGKAARYADHIAKAVEIAGRSLIIMAKIFRGFRINIAICQSVRSQSQRMLA